ncbi:MAG TPA: hypothetical protein VNT25_05740, partial [Allosphingosinicella sp.]|nr:hypothetical protein [Allosphingosinicella sp.]
IWYVDASYSGANGTADGSYLRPYTSLTELNGKEGDGTTGDDVDAAGDTIFVYNNAGGGTLTTGITLEANQKLYGDGHALTVNGLSIGASASNATVSFGGVGATSYGVRLDSGNDVRGISFNGQSASGTAIVDGGKSVGSLTISGVAVSGQGQIIDIDQGGTLNVTLTSASSSGSSGANGGVIDLNAVQGSFTVSGATSITGSHAQTGIDITNASGSLAAAFQGNVTVNTGANAAINFASNSTGSSSLTLSGSSKDIDTTSGAAVSFTGNTGATMTVSGGGLDIVTTTGNGLVATGGGTISVAGTGNSISSAGGTALDVTNTNISATGLTFQSISANGGTSAIVLNSTGTTAGTHGGLTITGDSGSTRNSSGGTIQNTSGAGISLTATRDVSLDQMNIQNTGGSGIDGRGTSVATAVTNFTFTNGTINNSGTGLGNNTSNIAFNDEDNNNEINLVGNVTITGNDLSRGYYHGVSVINKGVATITDLNVSNNSIVSATSATDSKGTGIQIIAYNGGDINKATINGNTITNFPSAAGIMVQGSSLVEGGVSSDLGQIGSAVNVIAITNNVISGQSSPNQMGTQGILANINGTGTANFLISGNQVTNTIGNSISFNVFGDAIANYQILNNTVTANNALSSAGIAGGTGATSGFVTNTAQLTVAITGNTVSQTDGPGIRVVTVDATTATLDVTIKNNNVSAPKGGTQGIRIQQGSTAGSDADITLDISGNTSAPGLTNSSFLGIGLRKQGTDVNINAFKIRGMSDPAPTGEGSPNVENYVNSQNPNGGGTLLVSATSGFTSAPTAGSSLLAWVPAPSDGVAAQSDGAEEPEVELDRGWPAGSGSGATSADSTSGVAAGSVASTQPATDRAVRLPSHQTSGSVVVDDGVLSQAELDLIVEAAILRWIAAGATADQVAAMRAVTISVQDLGGRNMGYSSTGAVTLDDDAAGWGWFIDATPLDDSEFAGAGGELTASAGPAHGRMDLLTTIMHELGHQIGFEDSYNPADAGTLMFGYLLPGERHLPQGSAPDKKGGDSSCSDWLDAAAGAMQSAPDDGGMDYLLAGLDPDGTAGEMVTYGYDPIIDLAIAIDPFDQLRSLATDVLTLTEERVL